MKLTATQKRILVSAYDRPCIQGGRGGWNTAQLRALARKGLVTLFSQAAWDSEWRLTPAGRDLSNTLHAEWLAAAKGLLAPEPAPEVCAVCGSPATVVVSAATLDGTLLDQERVCRGCAGSGVALQVGE